MNAKSLRTYATLFMVGTCFLSVGAAGAGELEPTAPPTTGTIKTLDLVEPRIPIKQEDIPLTINEPNSYYFAGNLKSNSVVGNAITIEADNVTIDLIGFELVGPGQQSGANYGIYMDGRYNVEIRNGTVKEFGADGICEYNLDWKGKEHRVINVRAITNGGYGIYLKGYAHLVKDCTVGKSSGGGMYIGHNSTVTGNTIFFNQNSGIYSEDGVTVPGNTVFKTQFCGIISGTGSTITSNTSYLNEDCGIKAYHGCLVTSNTVYRNNKSDTDSSSAGIWVNTRCLVKNNAVSFNKRNNIYVANGENAIEENLVTGSTGNGINVWGSGNFITSNRARGNTTDYTIAAGNAYGQIINVAGVGSFVNTDPTANYRF